MLTTVLLLLLCAVVDGVVRPHSLHSDLAVLQAGKPCFTGTADGEQSIAVTITQDNTGTIVATAQGTVTRDGYWKVCVSVVLSPNLFNHTVTMTAKPSGSTATNKGVLIGNVIMEASMSYAFNATAEIAASKTLGYVIRTAGVPGPWNHNAAGGAAAEPQFDTKIPMHWSLPSVWGFSAVCWTYGRRIHEAYPEVPLGLIESDVGGTNIEAWSPPSALAACGIAPTHRDPTKYACPPYCNSSVLFNGMIAPLLNYSIHHVVWYQGESNCGDPNYACSQQAMVSTWRSLWGRDFPFGFVELAGYDADRLPGELMASRVVAELRVQQQRAAEQAGVFYAVGMDLSDAAVMPDLNITTDVHSRFKEQIGERLALGGLAVAFGEEVSWKGPIAAAASAMPCTSTALERLCVEVRFEGVGAAGLSMPQHRLFELGYHNTSNATGPTTSYHNATASLLHNDTIMVQLEVPGVLDQSQYGSPVAVRYAQYNQPCNPLNDESGMSPGGGGAQTRSPIPTRGNQTAILSCSLYSEYPAPTPSGTVTLPARAFSLNVTSS